MKLKTTTSLLLTVVITFGIALSCSTEKDALLNIGYHNMTARYNGYFNAGVIIDETLASYRESYKEDYTKLLPIEVLPSEDEVIGVTPPLDDATKRLETVIVKHSMPSPEVVTNKKEERCRWIDDNWYLLAKINFIKKEYNDSKTKLNFIINTYKNETSIYEAYILLARVHVATGNFPEANRVLIIAEKAKEDAESAGKEKTKKSKVKLSKYQKKKKKEAEKKAEKKKDAEFPEDLIDDLELAFAEKYIAQEEFKKAIDHLENAIELTRKKRIRARYQFILAQLYTKLGNGSQAAINYNLVAKSNAAYELRFKAKILNALSATSGKDVLIKELDKMLKDEKNSEYKDQIYYAKAELDMKTPDETSAIENYSKSVLWSVNNNRQKGISYLKLADIHFDKTEYLSAQRYYDSCVQVLPEDYPGFEGLQSKANGLADLVQNYETVVYEDSVQRIASMSDKERIKFIEKTIKDIETAEELRKQEEERRLIAAQERINAIAPSGSGKSGKSYFSNSKLVASGFNDYRKLWGQRVLEDDWRRSDKNSVAVFLNDDGETIDSLSEDTGLTVEQLLADIPLTNEAMDSSNNKLMNSLYNLGIIYKEHLAEEKQAISYFNEVINRNIEHEKVLPAYYQLYLIHTKNGSPKADGYKQSILNKYPESEIAQILMDPDYLKKKEDLDKAEFEAYKLVMLDYSRRRYGPVITAANNVFQNEKDNQFINKYYLLKAFAISKIDAGNTNAISEPLKDLVQLSPDSEEGKQAKIYLGKLQTGEPIVPEDDQTKAENNIEESPYVVNNNEKHFFILVFPNNAGNASKAKVSISNFNKNFFSKSELSLTNSPLGSDDQIFIIRSFKDADEAIKYLKGFRSDAAVKDIGSLAKDHETFVINSKNFATLFKEKDIAQYMTFFKANYNL